MVGAVKIITGRYHVLCAATPVAVTHTVCAGLLVFVSADLGRVTGRCSPTCLLSPPGYDAPQPVQIVPGTWTEKPSPRPLKRGHLHVLSWSLYTGFCPLFLKYPCFSAISSNRENHY